MNEYEQIFCDNLWKELKCQIKGQIYCAIYNDILKIVVKHEDIEFKKTYGDMAKKIMSGEMTTKKLSTEFIKEYIGYINKMTREKYLWPPRKEEKEAV